MKIAPLAVSLPVKEDKTAVDNKGGIDLNPKNLTIRNSGKQVHFNVKLNVEDLKNARGLVPVIINITPITNVYQMLGLANSTQVSGV
ncbi:MAG: hypothetical protein HQL24_07180 [Candidatus Omnitrophica bacterium]|nr:hypothetical protein [Candidatus Omnitrophota bacterium]